MMHPLTATRVQNLENERVSHLEVDMEWSMTGWDVTRDGQLQSCVYDARDYDNYACSDFVAFTAGDDDSEEEGMNNCTALPSLPPLITVRNSKRYPRPIRHELHRVISPSPDKGENFNTFYPRPIRQG